MGLNGLIAKVTDPYERQARLWPALLAFMPAILTFSLLYGPISSSLLNTLMFAASCGGLYLLSNICREWGKNVETKLYKEWGGKPSTQLLRHRDSTINRVTKNRYHAFLAGKINLSFPTPEQEINDPNTADDVFDSGVQWLLGHTRDTERFKLLFKENITYGFRRNALGLKKFGLIVAIGSVLWVLIKQGVINVSAKYLFSGALLSSLPEIAIITLIISLLMLAVWLLFFTKLSVRTAAFTYAETLLKSCDMLNGK